MSLGLGAIPWVVMGEIFPEEAKDKASSLVVLFQWLCAFITSKFVKNINDALNVSGGYFFFGAMLLLGTMFILAYAPETKGKTNKEMKAFFMEHARLQERIINMS